MQFDANKDGKVAKNELPEPMQRIFERADSDNDGGIDQQEAEKLAEQFSQRRGRRPGPGADVRGRPAREQRPQRPE